MPTTDYIWEVTTPDSNLHKLKDAEAMRFKGTLGVGGTITALPSASASNRGDSYKVITNGTYASQEAHVGDWFTSDGSIWQLFTGSGGSGTTYTFEDGVNSFTVTPDGGTAQTVNVTPSIADATTSASGLMSASDKTKLNGIATGAEVNQNAFSNVKVGSTTVAADSKTDTLELVAGSNVTITPDATNDKITIAATNTHRPIQVNGTEILGNNTTALNLKAGSNISLTNSSGTVTIAATDTKYTAGTGLQLVGTQFLTSVPRLTGDANYKSGTNRFHMQEYSNASTNIPEAKWQHILTTQGSDGNYSTQLALGMTNVPSAYYRRMDSNNYSEWYRLTNALLQRYETGTITNGTWYRLFTINYTSYSYLHLRVLVKAGYANLYEAFICVRYTPNGMDGEYTSIRVIGSQPATKNLVLYKTSDTAIALAVCCDGAGSTMGFEIHDMHNESNTIKAENVSVENPFVALSARPTTFGKHYYLTGDYSDLANKPALNYLPLSGGTMTGVITAKGSVYEDSYSGALNMNNSNIYGLNSIYTADTADTAAEGIHFYRDTTHVDTLWICNGDLLFVPNRALGTSTSKADSQKVGRFTANPTSGQVVITDGTTGGMKSSGYTIAKSVPSNAVFTDQSVTASGNHYTPATVSGQDKSASASGATAAWSIDVVKGVTLNTDGKGHVTGLSVKSGKIPANPLPSNNITGSGTSGYIAKFNGTNTITNGPAFGSATTTYLRNDGSWATPENTKNTAGSTDTNSKIFLIGATSQAANPQTYSDDQVYTTSGTLQTNITKATAGVYANTASNGAVGGVSLYGSSDPHAYGVTMRNTGTSTGQLGKHGYVQGDWAGYLCFDGATNRGWVFRQAGNNIASVSGLGQAVFNGSVTVGGNAANTSGCRMVYDSTNECMNLEFAS